MLVSIQSMKPSPSSKCARQPNIPRASTHIHIERPSRHLPRLTRHIPIAEILPPDIESDSARSTRRQRHLLEAAKLLGRRSRSARRQTKIQLSDLGAGHSAVVCDLCSNGGDGIEETDGASWAWGGAASGLVGVGGGEGGVAEGCVGFGLVSTKTIFRMIEGITYIDRSRTRSEERWLPCRNAYSRCTSLRGSCRCH
jgi:hypothetical protein